MDRMYYGIFSNNQYNVSLDRRCLIGIGAKDVDSFSSWADAEESFEIRDIDFAMVDDALEDATGIQCLDRLRRVREKRIPVVVVTNDRRKETVLDCIAAGCGGYVLRPYSLQTLGRHLRAALNSVKPDDIEQELLDEANGLVSSGQFDEAIESFEELVEEENPANEYFRKGMKFLSEEKFGKAMIAFNKVIAMNEMYAEAYKGMAEAYKGKGNMQKYQEYLSKAGDVYAAQDRLDEARQVFVEILQNEPDAINPFNRLGVSLRKKGDYEGAIHAYKQACELTPDDANLYYNMARAYVFAGNFPEALKCVDRSMFLDPLLDHAAELREKVAQRCLAQESTAGKQDLSGRVFIDVDD